MSVVNLNKARKVKQRAEDKRAADANAVKHGRTKAARLLDAAQEAKAAARLDALKFEDD